MAGRSALVYDPGAAAYDFGPGHPLAPVRVELTHALIETSGLLDRPGVQRVRPRPVDPAVLRHLHDPAYVTTVTELSRVLADPGGPGHGDLQRRAATVGLSSGDTPAFAGMHEASLAVVGASIEAADLVLAGTVDHAFNPGGGLHHAMPDRAAGFCVYNDVAFAVDHLLRSGAERVAYVDIDVHHGDGVERMFRDDRRVLTVSLHESGRFLFPGTGEAHDIGGEGALGSAVNVPLAPQTAGEVWLAAFDAVVEPVVRAFQPDVLVTQLGCDTHVSDPLAHLSLTLGDMTAVYARLHRLAHEAAGGRWVATGGGGYRLVDVVPRAWTLAFAELSGGALPLDTPMPWQELVVARLGVTPPRSFDDLEPHLGPDARAATRAAAEESIATVRDLVFPHHGIR
jgi:acetoin utilization protein AcuC